ncbi:MAG: hypothetical protein IJL06_07325 [Kiritimatiellae bacterium]|nr:hypothetical protein [Kiritimatiellia bacterium]
MPLIEANVIPGASVYGVPQMSYTVAGAAGKDYSAALTAATLRESAAIEASAASYSAVVKERARKVDELGQVMAYLAEAFANLKVKDAESGDTATVNNGAWVNGTALKYGITLIFQENTANMTRKNIMKGQNEVQYAIDTEDNNLQQDMVALQGLLSKRDNAFSSASRIVRKADDAASSVIHNIV